LELVAESERKLRSKAFLGEADIRIIAEHADSVDIRVTTQDQWTTLLSTIFSQGGGRTVLGGAIEEYNLFGYGKQVYTEAVHEPEGMRFSFRYTDPQLVGSQWRTTGSVTHGPLRENYFIDLNRPFYSPDTKWAGGISASKSETIFRNFLGGRETNRYQGEFSSLQLYVSRAYGERFHKKRVQLGYRLSDRSFSALGQQTTLPYPDDERLNALDLSLSTEALHFAEEKRIDKFVRTEDLTLGRRSGVTLSRTGIPFPTGVRRFEVGLSHRESHQLWRNSYMIARLGFSTLFERDHLISANVKYYDRLASWQTLALQADLDLGFDLEPGTEYILGGDTGLRGYPANEFPGNKRLLINVEDRLFTGIEFLTVALGGVVFIDAGHVWPDGLAIDLSDLNYSAGFGFRLGYTKSPDSRVSRIDFAWRLNDGGFGITIGFDQMFTVN
jgi:outer membrane protein assembly factor BamA